MQPLYHFTSRHHLAKIMTEGITKGVLPLRMDKAGRVGFVRGWQWLTADPDWMQEWARPTPFSKLTYRRDEHRITVTIPEALRTRLMTWEDFARKYQPESAAWIETFKGTRHWRLFFGRIPPGWFLAVDRNPVREELIITEDN